MNFKDFDITSTKRTTGKGVSKYSKETSLGNAKKQTTGSKRRGPSSSGPSSTRATKAQKGVSSFIRGLVERIVYQWCDKCSENRVHNRSINESLIECITCKHSYKIEEKKVLN